MLVSGDLCGPFTHLNTRAPLAREGVITLTGDVMVVHRVKRKSTYVNSPPRPKIKIKGGHR